jgi:hypothetical protein
MMVYSWNSLGRVSGKTINVISKFKNKILVGTNAGLYQDNGTFYSGRLQLQLLDVFEDLELSASVAINDIFVHEQVAYIALSDGKYIQYGSDFVTNQSKLGNLHKILKTQTDTYLFGGNNYQLSKESYIKKLATGSRLR